MRQCGASLHPIQENATLKSDAVEAPATIPAPHSCHSTASRVVKGEDVLYIHPLAIATQPQSMLYMVCDGHSGSEAANYVAANFVRILNSYLPAKAPNMANVKEVEAFAEVIRQAVVETFVRLDNDWIAVGHMSGTTVTAAILVGYLLTVANLGDSSAVLDTGCSILELTGSHRIQSNPDEQSRLRSAGCTLAPLGFHLQGPARQGELGVGPLRLWPGGLCVSRSVGDLDAGPEVVPLPHIRQVLLPAAGSRVIICSDGVWDLMSLSKAVKLCRFKPAPAATSALMAAVSRDLRLLDDASIIVIDLLPSETTNWPTVALKANPKPEKSGGLFACFRPELDEPDSRDLHISAPGHLSFLADLDSLRVYPQMRAALQRSQIQHLATVLNNAAGAGKPPFDFTMHGANKISLYRGYMDGSVSNGGASGNGNSSGMVRTNSSTAVAEVASEGANVSQHSLASAETPSGALKAVGGMGIGLGIGAPSEFESPVIAFSSPNGSGPRPPAMTLVT
ncbi:hypothetical protein PLESTB_000088500 [Pleodorina starrii]|uniref:PPM-type phosphatase domain-containing protein n=1 Tax=Pleodorina starrii TaxID=330485 RepID=A0A9W6BA32_9CHLO|nr:hypothetical protein PLESTM_000084900 [Pleodorina starrii]GLC48369.1 hypothetical protein PLESTB_000088500 [Pleodorina starrii]GLC76571.1 hypothetical protein PLESTF_001798700 [Pleodorina starrii]